MLLVILRWRIDFQMVWCKGHARPQLSGKGNIRYRWINFLLRVEGEARCCIISIRPYNLNDTLGNEPTMEKNLQRRY